MPPKLIYLELARSGYGDRFEAELADVCVRVGAFPSSGTPILGYPAQFDVRAYPMATFPYSLMITKSAGKRVVYAVAHQHRKPGYWSARLAP